VAPATLTPKISIDRIRSSLNNHRVGILFFTLPASEKLVLVFADYRHYSERGASQAAMGRNGPVFSTR